MPATQEIVLRRFSEEELAQIGDVLWRLLETCDALVQAFPAKYFDPALGLASDVDDRGADRERWRAPDGTVRFR